VSRRQRGGISCGISCGGEGLGAGRGSCSVVSVRPRDYLGPHWGPLAGMVCCACDVM
jgi:hypothetical protein